MQSKHVLIVAVLSSVGCAPVRDPVDLVLHNGAIYTMNAAEPKAQAMAVVEGRIVAVGTNHAITVAYTRTTDVDLKGQMVLPGLHDAHAHPVLGGVELGQCSLRDIPPQEIGEVAVTRTVLDGVTVYPR